MRLDISQQLRLQQQMRLSPRMIQAMEILQLPMMALQDRVQQELSSNPCLELKEGGGEAESLPAEEPDRSDEPLVLATDRKRQADFERLDNFGEAHAENLEWAERRVRPAGSGERDAKMDALANTPAPGESLADHLLRQWTFVEVPDPIKEAGRKIIAAIDENGYLRTPLEELTGGESPSTLADLSAALPLVQKLDPPGVAARDLRECLLIQLDAEAQAGDDVALQQVLVSEHLRDIEMNHIPQIVRRTSKSVSAVKAAITALGRLDPRPGRLFGYAPAPYVLPDAVVDIDDEGNIVVSMREGEWSSLRLSREYEKLARARNVDRQTRDFVRQNLRSAQWLIGAIRQRRQTVRRVIEEVFAAQRDFLERGPEALRPLPMTDVAGRVGVHVATVSRAVAGKYVQTPRGVFPLRMFFSGGTTTSTGQELAWDAVKARLREIIDQEDKSQPLGDEAIAKALSTGGVTIARRTVAKYRGLLNISPARQRKKY